MKIVPVKVDAPCRQQSHCGFTYAGCPIRFPAPIDLVGGDRLIVDAGSGQPLAVYRDRLLIWRYEPGVISGSFTFTLTPEQQAAMWAALGMGSKP